MNRILGAQAKQRDIDFATEFNGTFKKGGTVTASFTKARDETPSDYTIVVKQHSYDSISLELSVEVDLGDLNDGARRVFDWLDGNPDVQFTVPEIMAGTGQPERTARRHLSELSGKQLVVKQELRTQRGMTVLYSVPGEKDEVGIIKNKVA